MDEEKVRQQLLNKLEDLTLKIRDNEPFPEENIQNISFLYDVIERIDECLNCWYY